MAGFDPFLPLALGHSRAIAKSQIAAQEEIMKPDWRWSIFIPIALVGCAGSRDHRSEQRFTGWMRYHGEMMLFDAQKGYLADTERRCAAGQECHNPLHCISGVFAGEAPVDIGNHNGERVIVLGRLVSYRTLPDEDTPVLPRKILSGKVVMNYCLRDEVILITSVAPA